MATLLDRRRFVDNKNRRNAGNTNTPIAKPLQIGRGLHADIWLSLDGKRVRKSYRASNGTSPQDQAEREFETLKIAHRAVGSTDGIAVPQPIQVIKDSAELEMEFCPGVPLPHALRQFTNGRRETVVPLIAKRFATAIELLTDEIPVDRLDFSVRNTLVDPESDRMVLLDFTERSLSVMKPSNVAPIEFVLSGFIASALTFPLHRSDFGDPRSFTRLSNFARDVIDSISSRRNLDLEKVRLLAWQSYRHRSRNGGFARWLWFSTVGKLIFAWLLRRTIP
jgi:hypothetical protein